MERYPQRYSVFATEKEKAMSLAKKCAAEFFGTFWLTFGGCGAAVLAAVGGSLHDVVKTTVFVSDLGAFGEINAAYEQSFGDHRPARATVEVARLPRDVAVEIEAVAYLPAR